MRIAFTINSLIRPIGGAERSLTELANEMVRRGHEVEIVVNEREALDPNARPFYPLDESIRIHTIREKRSVQAVDANDPKSHPASALRIASHLRRKRVRKQFFKSTLQPLKQVLRVTELFREYEKRRWLRKRLPLIERWKAKLEALSPEIVIAFMPHCFTYTSQALRDNQVPLLICYRNDPEVDHLPWRYMNNSYDHRMRLKAPEIADAVCVQLESYREFFPPAIQEKIACIPNIVHPSSEPIDFEWREACTQKTIISVGRLAHVKNHELLIHAFARLYNEFPQWKLEIYGKGHLDTNLHRLIERLGIDERVTVHEPIRDIGAKLARAHIFAFPSRWEGFSRAHTEAMARGLPSVALRECRYSNEFLSRSGAGYLAEDNIADFAEKLRMLMSDGPGRSEMGRRAIEFVSTFESKSIFDQWEELSLRIARCKSARTSEVGFPPDSVSVPRATREIERPLPL